MLESKKILQENNVDKVFFYTRTTSFLNNLYTTCILVDSITEQIKARGISICSVKEIYSKEIGKKKAYARALMALLKKKNSEKINVNRKNDFSTIKRNIKLKKYTYEKFTDLTDEISKIDPNYKHVEIDGVEKIFYFLPVTFPIKMAGLTYKYKSQYLPNPATREEVIFLKNVKIRKERAMR